MYHVKQGSQLEIQFKLHKTNKNTKLLTRVQQQDDLNPAWEGLVPAYHNKTSVVLTPSLR